DGFWRRMKLVRFDTQPAKRDKHLGEHLLSTKSAQQAILAWIVAGAQEWHRDGLAEPAEIAGANALYREEQNPLRDYLCERTIWGDVLQQLDPGSREVPAVAKAVLRLDYMAWAKDNGIEPISARQFAERLRDLGAVDDGYAYNADRDRSDRAWTGLRLRDPSHDNGLPTAGLPYIPGGPLAYQPPASDPAADSAAEDPRPHFRPDPDPADLDPAAPVAGSAPAPESGKMCGGTSDAATQPLVPQQEHGTALSPPHLRAPARDTQTHDANVVDKGSLGSIRARSTSNCGSAAEGDRGSPEEKPSDPPPGSRGAKLRQPPNPAEDLFADPPPPLREPGADEDEPWPPPTDPTPT
ncbi:MAG: hypothetical protein RL456_2344, partial [Pseudomonadota bacterium]